MIPKEITSELVDLKEKAQAYSLIQRSLDAEGKRNEVYEIKAEVDRINKDVSNLSNKLNNILVDGLISKFDSDNWFESLKDKNDFPEPNPRILYEEEQQEIEKQRKIVEEKTKKETEELHQVLKAERLKQYQELCFNGPDDVVKVRRLINDGFNIREDGRIYDLSTLISRGRSLGFISFLVETGMKINEEEQQDLQYRINIEQTKAKNIIEEYQKKLKERRNDEFKTIWYYGPEDIYKVQKLINDGFDITQANVGPSIRNLISRGRSMKFIKYLITAGLKITFQDFEFCLKSNSSYNAPDFINFLLSAKNIDQDTIVMVKAALKKKEEEEQAEQLAREQTAKAALKQKEEEERILLEQESKLNKLKELTQGKYNSFYKLLKDGDIKEINHVFSFGLFDINQSIKENDSEITYSILSIFEPRGIEFIQMLVDSGYLVTKEDIDHYYNTEYSKLYYLNCKEFPYFYKIFNILISAQNIEKEAIDKVKEIKKEEERIQRIQREQSELKEKNKKKVQALRIEEFKTMCHYSYAEDKNKLKKLIEEGLDINNINDFDCLQTCISKDNKMSFIQFLVDLGVLVKNKHIEYCYTNKLHGIISILEKAENIEDDAVKNIIRRTKNTVIGSISVTCIFIFSLFMPQILNREMDIGYYILMGILTILFLLIAIIFIVELRKKSKITNANPLNENQLPTREQTGYETPNSQDIVAIAESVKIKKMILWIVVTLISISIIALIYIYFDQVIAFLKVMLILAIVFALFAWRYSPNKRR